MQGLESLVSQIREKVRSILQGSRACALFDICCGLIEDSYFLKFLLLSVVMNCILPIFAFAVFAVVSLFTTVTGFILLEGALLILGACAAILWFGVVGILFILTAAITTPIYLLYRHAEDIACKIERFYFSPSSENPDNDMVVVDTGHED